MGYKYKYRLQQLYKPIDAFTICLQYPNLSTSGQTPKTYPGQLSGPVDQLQHPSGVQISTIE